MSQTVIVHLVNEDPVVGEIESLPDGQDQSLVLSNVRRRDGRDVSYVLPETSHVIYPWARIHCIEVLPTEAEKEVVTFIRE
jgi:hypothetical protein